ncbi:MAG: dethiobiotin synthase [Polyangiales bacterium]
MIIAVSGTGTGVGKTTTAVALVRALRAAGKNVGAWKPIETGGIEDGERLGAAAGSDAVASIRLRDPVAPSVAARREGRRISVADLASEGRRRAGDPLVIETAGGLFSPLNEEETNAELVLALAPDVHLLVAPNRLGVLHEVEACRRACRSMGLRLDLVVLTGRGADESVGTNAEEIGRTLPVVALETEHAVEPLLRWLDSAHRR